MSALDRATAAKRLEAARKELAWFVAEASLDVAGIFDPTPASDLAAASLALARGDLWGAGLSLLGCVPYVGDAIGKTAKGAALGRKVTALRHEIEVLVQQMAKNPGLKAGPASRPASYAPSGNLALTDGGISMLSRGLPLPPWATDFRGWRGKKVLDAGAGGGTFVRELRGQGVEAYGFDIVADTFKKAGVRHNDHFVQAAADKIPMRDGAFDAASSNWSVFYYFERGQGEAKTAAYLAELTRVVKPGGEIRLFGVDPRAAAVMRTSRRLRVERAAGEVSGTIPVMVLRVLP